MRSTVSWWGRASIVAAAVATAAGLVATPVHAAPAPPEATTLDESPTGRYLVEFARHGDADAMARRMERKASKTEKAVDHLSRIAPLLVVEMPYDAAVALEDTPGVVAVVPDEIVTVDEAQTPAPWGLDRIDQASLPLDNRFGYVNRGQGVTAYILDSGVADLPDFDGRVRTNGYTAFADGDAVGSGAPTADCAGHGTHVAGIVGSATYGVAKDVTIVPVRVLGAPLSATSSCQASGSLYDIFVGVNWVLGDHTIGAAVLNASLGSQDPAPLPGQPESDSRRLWRQAIDALVQDGIVPVVSAGNNGGDACGNSPAYVPNALTVGAVSSTDAVSQFSQGGSNTGTCVDLFAPGSSIPSWWFDGSAQLLSGTSMAAPHVTGAVALLLAENPSLAPLDAEALVTSMATTGVVQGALNGAPNRLLRVQALPANDDFAAATQWASDRSLLADTSSAGATRETGEPFHADRTGTRSLWWRTTAPAAGRLWVSTSGSSYDTVLGLYTGNSVGALTPVDADDNGADGVAAQMYTSVAAGTTYSIAADGATAGAHGPLRVQGAFVAADNGWFGSLATPQRLVDTRPGNVGTWESTALGDRDTKLAAGEVMRIDVGGITELAGDAAIAVNLTTVGQVTGGFLTVWPCAATTDPLPPTSSLNFGASQVVANSALVGLTSNGFCVTTSADTDLIVDVTGGYGDTKAYTPLSTPARAVDTRPGQLGVSTAADENTPYAAGEVRRYIVTASGELPSGDSVGGLAVNLTAVAPSGIGFLSAWPCDDASETPPDTSVLNYRGGQTTASAGMLALAADGGFCVRSSATAHVIVDITGTYPKGSSAVSSARPQRLLDTREGNLGTLERTAGADTATPIPQGVTQRYVPRGSAGVPSGNVAAAAVINLTVVNAPTNGFVTVWPCAADTDTVPNVSAINFRAGGAVNNGAIVSLAKDGICVQASQTIDLVIDVTGWSATQF